MEQGQYIRINKTMFSPGGICKILNIFDWRGGKMIETDKGSFGDALISLNSEPSFNLIDLVKPMDLLFIDISPDRYGGIVVPRVPETESDLEVIKNNINSGANILKGVLTQEQISSEVYWIEGQ